MGTTMFRPNYTPVTFGAVAGRHCGHIFEPVRYTALHHWHLKNGAEFEDVGQWKRPWYFPKSGEDLHAAVKRECKAVRDSVGLLDASTLGKIDIQGPDAREFLNRVYTNAWTKLDVGKARYGLMCKEDGMVFDDGVTACLADNHFVMTTTTGGAARVLQWLEIYHQTEWPDLKVYFTSVTDHWATMTLSGPNSRKLLSEVTDTDLSNEAFPFMTWKEALVGGVPARVFRISFTGELSYEVNVQADYAMGVLEKIVEAGKKYNLTPYGTETMHVLRAEKGFIIVGQDTDSSMTPDDLNMGWCVGRTKPFSWIGWRGMNREDCVRDQRKQLVGLKPIDPNVWLPEGAQLVFNTKQAIPMTMVGHVTSATRTTPWLFICHGCGQGRLEADGRASVRTAGRRQRDRGGNRFFGVLRSERRSPERIDRPFSTPRAGKATKNSGQVLYDRSQCLPTTPNHRGQGRVVAASRRPRQPGGQGPQERRR